jgi:diguanylate cyclase (GGDEF)-like protein
MSVRHREGAAVTAPNGEKYSDEATGLPTKRVFLEELRRRVAESHRYKRDLSVAIVSIDDYEAIANREVRAARYVLSTVARLIGSVLREPDLIARFDEESFCVLLPSTPLDGASPPMNRLREGAATFSDPQYVSLSFAVSVGVVQLLPGETPGSFLHRAESALAIAIDSGGKCLATHDGVDCELTKSDAVLN